MKTSFTFLLFIFSICVAKTSGQTDSIPEGAYRNFVDFSRNSPLYECDFNFLKKYNKTIPELHDVSIANCDVDPKTIDNTIWAIYCEGSFYLNAEHMGMKKGFIKIDKLKKYSYFKGIPVKSLAQKDRMKHSIINFGATGALVTSMKISNENANNSNYVLNIETGMVNVLDGEYMLRILKPYPELLFYFEHDENNNSLQVILNYLDQINEKEEF